MFIQYNPYFWRLSHMKKSREISETRVYLLGIWWYIELNSPYYHYVKTFDVDFRQGWHGRVNTLIYCAWHKKISSLLSISIKIAQLLWNSCANRNDDHTFWAGTPGRWWAWWPPRAATWSGTSRPSVWFSPRSVCSSIPAPPPGRAPAA